MNIADSVTCVQSATGRVYASMARDESTAETVEEAAYASMNGGNPSVFSVEAAKYVDTGLCESVVHCVLGAISVYTNAPRPSAVRVTALAFASTVAGHIAVKHVLSRSPSEKRPLRAGVRRRTFKLSGADLRNHSTDYGGNTHTHPKESMPDKAHCIRLLDPFLTLGVPCVRTTTKMDAM